MDAHLRVHTGFIDQANLVAYCERYCSKAYIVHEVEASREHYQGYVRFDIKYQNLESLRNSLKRYLTDKGNRVYSISLARESVARHMAYLMKEGGEPVFQKNITITDIRSARELVEDFKKRQAMTSIEKLAHGYSGADDVREVCKYVMDEMKRQGRMLPDPRLMKRYIQSIQFIKWPEVYLRKYQDEVLQLFSW